VEDRAGGGASFHVLIPRGDPEHAPHGASVAEHA
jgi:hypothetical protein